MTMDAGTDKDDGIFYYSNGLNDLKALADKSMEDSQSSVSRVDVGYYR